MADATTEESERAGREGDRTSGRLVWFLVDRASQHGAVESVARRLEEDGVETEVVSITDVIGSAAREAVAGGAERILRGLRVALQGQNGEEDFLQAIRRERPDLLVVTSARHVRPLSLLESLTGTSTAQIGLPLDFELGPEWLDGSIDAFLVPDGGARERLADVYDDDRLFAAGPPILPNFEGEIDRDAVRDEFGFDDETVALVRADSYEPQALDRLVFQASLVDADVTFVFHHNGDGAIAQVLRESADEHGLPAAMFGRVRDLQRHVAASDVVVAAPFDPYLPEIVALGRPVYLAGEGSHRQRETLERQYGAGGSADLLRFGNDFETFVEPERLEEARSDAESTTLTPGNERVAEALREALGQVEAWLGARSPRTEDPTPEDAGAPTDDTEKEAPFETIGDGDDRDGESRRGPASDLSKAEAKDQLAELILVERDLERRLTELEREQERWRDRLDLARDWGEDDLAEEAEDVLREYIDDASDVRDELEDVRAQKEKLKRAARSGRGAQKAGRLESAADEESADRKREDELERRFEEMELDRDLEDLRGRVDDELGD